LGVLIGIFVVCAFVLHNYVNLNIGLKLALGQAVAYFVQWAIVGIVIGLIYKPLATPQSEEKTRTHRRSPISIRSKKPGPFDLSPVFFSFLRAQ
jgi:uncharacterized membrane protein